jgi:predicted acetyltransferase
MSVSEVRLRPADEADAPWLANLWAAAFPGKRTSEVRLRELRAGGRHGGLETCRVGERGGERVGGLRSYALRMSLWGRDLPTQGLAAVAVAPQFRRQGLGDHLCRMAMRQARAEGQVASLLFPFRVDFYARLGYTLAGRLHRYEVAPGEFPVFSEGRRVRPLDAAEAMEAVPAFYERVRLRTQGLIHRSRDLWSFLAHDGTRVVAVPAETGGIRGYLVSDVNPGRFRRSETLSVRESLVEDLEAHRALLGWIALQRDQWRRVVYDALPGEHLERVLGHPRREGGRGTRPGALWYPSATLLRGPMLRILDLEEVLSWLRLAPGAPLRVRDEVIPENEGEWHGDGAGGVRREAEPGDASATAPEGASETGPGGAFATAPAGASAPEPEGALSVSLVTEMLLDGALPGMAAVVGEWRPLLGIRDFRLLDTF